MKNRSNIINFLTAFIMFFLCISLYSQEQSKVVKSQQLKAEKIKLEMKKGVTRSVVKGGGTSASYNKDLWGKISINYLSNPKWADEVKIKFYALLYNKDIDSKKSEDYFTLLVGDITYVNVEKGDHFGEMFIHPNTLKRYGEIKEIRAELIYNGIVEDVISQSFSSSKERAFLAKWWTKYQPKNNELLNRFLVPFIHDGDNAHETIKLS